MYIIIILLFYFLYINVPTSNMIINTANNGNKTGFVSDFMHVSVRVYLFECEREYVSMYVRLC